MHVWCTSERSRAAAAAGGPKEGPTKARARRPRTATRVPQGSRLSSGIRASRAPLRPRKQPSTREWTSGAAEDRMSCCGLRRFDPFRPSGGAKDGRQRAGEVEAEEQEERAEDELLARSA